ncbi:putative kelch-type beta propeller, F-box-like domain superfamily [Dioscorea sansibarensis]
MESESDPDRKADPDPAPSSSSPSSPSPFELLPPDALHEIMGRLALRPALAARAACRFLREALPPESLPTLRLLALRHPRHSPYTILVLDPSFASPLWLSIPLSFLPFPSPSPVASSPSLLLLWADTPPSRSLIVCNPLARAYRVLPPLGSAWSRHGTVLAAPGGAALVLTELAALSYTPGSPHWLKSPLNLPSKPRSPILMSGSIFTLCDIGSPWRSQWKLFSCSMNCLGGWTQLERHDWGDVFDILKRPRLIPGAGGNRILMIGGLRSSFAVDAPCSTVLILGLDLGTMEWDEFGRMPPEMYRCFAAVAGGNAGGNNKVKVFGGDGRVWFSGKRARGKLAMWEEDREVRKGGGGAWKWVDGVPGYTEGVYRGFVFDAGFTAMP